MSARCCWCGSALGHWLQDGVDERPWMCANDACKNRQMERAVLLKMDGQRGVRPLYVPTPRQVEWHEAVYDRGITRLLVGGHAGPGKSRWLRETLYELAQNIPGFHGLLLRRTHKDLDQSHLRFVPYEVAQRGGTWKISERIVEFPHGQVSKGRRCGCRWCRAHKGPQANAIIRMGHLEDAGALQNYLSAEYDVIAPDELVTFDRDEMLELFSRARSTNKALYAARGDGKLDGSIVIAATNPGGKGARWVKDFFIDKTPDTDEFRNYRPERWAFKAARLEDNPYIQAGYRETLEDLPEIRRRQLLEGDWDAWEGQFFAMSARTHSRTLTIPRPIEDVIEAGDWGYTAPGTVAWYVPVGDHHWHVIAEWKFKKLTAEEVARGIVEKRAELGIKSVRYSVWDPSIFNKTGHGHGESIAETLARFGVTCRKGDNDRVMGWMRLAAFYRPAPDGIPWLTYDPSCKYALRSIPALLADEHDPEDVDTSQDDHAADRDRYFAQSRPLPGDQPTVARRATVPNSWGFWRQWHTRASERASAIA